MKRKPIITSAITGGLATPTMSPYLPYKPEDIIAEAVRSYEAGAAVVHIHVRNPSDGSPSHSLDLYRQVITEIKSQCDVIISITTGGAPGMTLEQRSATIPEFKPELASFNAGSLSASLAVTSISNKSWKFPWEEEYVKSMEDNIFSNSFKTLRTLCRLFEPNETKPELEIYDVGMINNIAVK